MSILSVSKVRASLSIAALAIVALVPASCALAQQTRIRVQVPFGFENGSQHLPAGLYTIGLNSRPTMLILGPSSGGFAMTNPGETLSPASKSKVVFHRYGNRLFLREVWIAGSRTHTECVKSQSEKRLEIASSSGVFDGMEVAALETRR